MPHRLHLSKDKKLKKIIEGQEPYVLQRKKNICLDLCYSIMSQQLSIKVAAVFHQRFLALYNNKTPSNIQIANTKFETLRGIGLSNAKANYVLNVARFFIEEKITDGTLYKMSNEAIINYLTRIKGVGQWTAEMVLMFSLGREDVFPMDDLGIQQAMCKLYKIETSDKKKRKEAMLVIAEKWIPYRTYASRYLWGWKDNS
ncbi:MAG: DNA-3-methyladenine glycosylase 2 family protein [Chitinophagaceae bacterium]